MLQYYICIGKESVCTLLQYPPTRHPLGTASLESLGSDREAYDGDTNHINPPTTNNVSCMHQMIPERRRMIRVALVVWRHAHRQRAWISTLSNLKQMLRVGGNQCVPEPLSY